ncbi:heat shock protein DnaJ with tetratricopeptide repeat-containing protein [Actinidia rufa]|uniref:Heat shock protein DnaJ with tetratricopeptide repeat-containing protein n=1 Tax=Actinidia rufa TaxID=165716 RepID=A0A7J0HCD0_9ERIC|nr:heat shock protein DnaJ with tetratricopeptide repeat-containing protein [Actinidia rufa]
MSPALLDSRNPNPNGQISTPFSSNFSGFSSIIQSKAMNLSNSNSDHSRFSSSNEIASEIGTNKPGFGPALGSASSRSKPRLLKLKRQSTSNNPRSTLSSENAKVDSGFNPFRPISDNSIPSNIGAEMGSSFSGKLNFGNVGNEGFVFGVSQEKLSANSNSNVGNSSGFVGNKIVDDINKLKFGSEQEFVSTTGPDKGVPEFGSASGIDESEVSKLPKEIRKLNIKGSGNVETFKNAKDVNSKLSVRNKTHLSFESGKNVGSSFGTSVESELPNELNKLNIKDAGDIGGGSRSYNADNVKKFTFGDVNKGNSSFDGSSASILPDEMKNLNIKDSVGTYGGEKKEVNVSASDRSGFAFGSTTGATDSFVGRTESMLSDEMVKLRITREVGDNTGQRQTGFGSCALSAKEALGNFGSKKLQDMGISSSAVYFQSVQNATEVPCTDRPEKKNEFTFASSWDGMGTPHVEFTTPSQKGNIYTDLDKKLDFSAKLESAKGTRKSNSQEHSDSFEAYPPMDVSPYQETLADNTGSRETSVTSEEAFHLYVNNASSESGSIVPNNAIEEDLVVATQCLGIDEDDLKCTETKVEGSEYRFGKGVGAEGPSVESVLMAETESFITAAEQFDCSSDSFVTPTDTEVTSSLRIERQDSDDSMQFGFASAAEDAGGTNFMFSASSSAQGQSSSTMRHHKKKSRVKGIPESYSSTPNTKVQQTPSSFFPFSDTTLPLSPKRGQKGDLPTSFRKRADKSEAVKEQETKQSSMPAATIAAQEVCEKWRLRHKLWLLLFENVDFEKYRETKPMQMEICPELRSITPKGNRAATRMSLGRMREALEDCINAAAIEPNFLRVQVRAANACNQEVKPAWTEKLVLEASEGLEKAQKVSEFMKQSAELLQRRTSSDAESALGVIAQALTISSCCEKLLEMKADALFTLRKYKELIRLCEQTVGSAEMNCSAKSVNGRLTTLDCSDIQKNPSFSLWRWQLIIKSYFSLGRLEEALDFLKNQGESISTTKKSLESLIPLAGTIRELVHHKAAGNEAFQSGKHAEAADHYTAALSCTVESRPFAAVCFCNRAAAYKDMGQIADAIADCSLAIALDGNYLKAISRRATLFEMIRDYEQASRDLQRLVSLLMNQVEDKANLSGASDRSSIVNELRQAQQRLSATEEESRKDIPLNMYLILGIDSSVTASEIKKAYRKAALRHHPDKAGQSLAKSENGDDGLWKEVVEGVYKDADRLFKMIGEAYAVLSDPTKRSQYDLEEEMRSTQKRGNGGNTSRMHTDAQNYPFERSSSSRQRQEVWRSYGNPQSRAPETRRSSRY